jgi:hypothetical protein
VTAQTWPPLIASGSGKTGSPCVFASPRRHGWDRGTGVRISENGNGALLALINSAE